uniref:Protein kinase domain-containing protein n=2 Tax=Paramoeba aestuarina TaxID=180227 RepID=A0A7S4KTD0_9EUKA|mmetsp:Transcript_25137/g.39188  ORF Transcript_25137/g.39188 Transcript_25137/m.39188 type:complete len:732 (+) Transcript_25137:160-2355(+)
MELLGENIAEKRRLQQGRFSMLTTLKLGIQMLRGIEAIHELGYLHRDIKPSNFALGLYHKKDTCFIIDFGLARRYKLPNGEIRPPRDMVGFRGTARYASIFSHQSRDLGRRDDLWSLFYLMVESALGQLPWRKKRDKDLVGEMKMKYSNEELVAGLPPEFLHFVNHLHSLHYHSCPDYNFLANMFGDLYTRLGGTESTPFDWDRPKAKGAGKIRPLPSLLDHCLFVSVINARNLFTEKGNEEFLQKIPPKIRKKMFELYLQMHEGDASSSLLGVLIDKKLRELDLSRSNLSQKKLLQISQTLTSLRTLTLKPSDDDVIIDFVTQNPNLEEIRLLEARNLTNRGIKGIISHCPKLRVFEVRNGEKVNDKSLEMVMKQCDQLTELVVKDCKKVKGGVIKTFAGDTGTLRSKRPPPFHLTSMEISGCCLSKGSLKKLCKLSSNLEKLHLDPLSMAKGKSEISTLLGSCSRMRDLALTTYGPNEVSNDVLWEIARECKQLEVLKIGLRSFFEQQVVDILNNCSNLKELHIYQETFNSFAATSLPRSLRLLSSLRKLFIKFGEPSHNQSSVSDSAIKGFLHTATDLTHISLNQCFLLSPHCFPDNCYYPNLTYLDFSDCVHVGDPTIKKAAAGSPNLTFFGLNRLNNIGSESLDAISEHCLGLEKCEMLGVVCFTDGELKQFLRKLFKCFLKVTRYINREMVGVKKEVHISNTEEIFKSFPNTHRDFIFTNLAQAK